MDLVQRMRYNKKGKIWYETWSKELDYRGKNAYFDLRYVGDDYYYYKFEQDIMKNRKYNEKLMRI